MIMTIQIKGIEKYLHYCLFFYSNFAECHDSGGFEDSSHRCKNLNVKNVKVVYSELNFEIASTIVFRHVTVTEETNIATAKYYQKGEPNSSEIFKANKFSIDIFVFKNRT